MRLAVVKAAYDDGAGVWFVDYSDVGGLHVEGETKRLGHARRPRPFGGAQGIGRNSRGCQELDAKGAAINQLSGEAM
jgi:hypothetical protein